MMTTRTEASRKKSDESVYETMMRRCISNTHGV